MPRMFDMLRGGGDEGKDADRGKDKKEDLEKDPQGGPSPQEKENEAIPGEHCVSFPKKEQGQEPREEKKEENENYSLSPKKLLSSLKNHGAGKQGEADDFYEKAVKVIETLVEKVRAKEPIQPYMETVYSLLNELFNHLVLGDLLLESIYKKEEEGSYYLPRHIVNVLFIASFLGIRIGLNKSNMKHLGLACVFYDIGLDKFKEVLDKPSILNEEERAQIKGHIKESLDVLRQAGEVKKIVKDAISMHHERSDGSGYPDGLRSGDINPYAKILGLVDTYEAISHKRSYRESNSAHQAIKLLLDSLKEGFDSEVLKLLIDKMSIYPIGMIVKLDTEETARVINVKPGSPLKPVVLIVKDAYGNMVSERKVIDLSEPNSPSIVDSE